MADNKKTYPMPVAEKKSRDLERRGVGEESLAGVYTSYSDMPFVNKFRAWTTRTYRRAIQEEKGLADDLIDHQRALSRLKDVDIEIETDKTHRRADLLAAQIKLKELGRKAGLLGNDDEIERLERTVRKAELEARLKALQNPVENDKIEKLRRDLKEKIQKKEVYNDYEIEKIKLDLKKDLMTASALETIFAEVADEIFHGKDPDDLTDEEKQEYKKMETIYESLKASD